MFDIFLRVFFFAVVISYLWRKTPMIIAEVKRSISMAKSALKIKEAMKPVPFIPMTQDETKALRKELNRAKSDCLLLENELSRSQKQSKETHMQLLNLKELAAQNGISHLLGL